MQYKTPKIMLWQKNIYFQQTFAFKIANNAKIDCFPKSQIRDSRRSLRRVICFITNYVCDLGFMWGHAVFTKATESRHRSRIFPFYQAS